jgi:hypothetical protein
MVIGRLGLGSVPAPVSLLLLRVCSSSDYAAYDEVVIVGQRMIVSSISMIEDDQGC